MEEQNSEHCPKCYTTIHQDTLKAHLSICQSPNVPSRQKIQPISPQTVDRITHASDCQETTQARLPLLMAIGKHVDENTCGIQPDSSREVSVGSRQSLYMGQTRYEQNDVYAHENSTSNAQCRDESSSNNRTLHISAQSNLQSASNPSNTLSANNTCAMCNREISRDRISNHCQTCFRQEVAPTENETIINNESVAEQSEYDVIIFFRLNNPISSLANGPQTQEQQIQHQPGTQVQPSRAIPQQRQSETTLLRQGMQPASNDDQRNNGEWHPARIIFRLDNTRPFMVLHITGQLIQYLNGGNDRLDQSSRNSLQRLKFENDESESSACCAICQQDLIIDDELLRLRCRHIFHENCLNPWLNENSTCPLCKQDQNIDSNID